MNIDTNKLVELLKEDQPLSVMVVEEHGKDKLVCLFALPELAERITEFGKELLNEEQNGDW